MKKAVFCLASSDKQARRIVERLLSLRFANEDISVLYPENESMNKSLFDRPGVSRDAFEEERTSGREEVVYEDTRVEPYTEKQTPSKKGGGKGGMTTEIKSKAPEGAVVGATTGGVVGGSVGLLAGLGALSIPGLGPFIAAGPLMAALSGSGIGGSLGLLIGALTGYGVPEFEAKKYQAGLKEGNILISVHVDNNEEIKRAEEMMKREGAKEITTASESAKSSYL